MTTKVNLPIILEVSEPAYFDYIQNQLVKIIPRVKFEELGFDNGVHKAIYFTRKDKKFRTLIAEFNNEATTPVTEETVTAVNQNG